jgi:hypothetical protein
MAVHPINIEYQDKLVADFLATDTVNLEDMPELLEVMADMLKNYIAEYDSACRVIDEYINQYGRLR